MVVTKLIFLVNPLGKFSPFQLYFPAYLLESLSNSNRSCLKESFKSFLYAHTYIHTDTHTRIYLRYRYIYLYLLYLHLYIFILIYICIYKRYKDEVV